MFSNLFIMLTDQSSSEMLIGYNKHSRRRDSMVYTNITVNPIRSNYEARLQNIHLHKLVCMLLGFWCSHPFNTLFLDWWKHDTEVKSGQQTVSDRISVKTEDCPELSPDQVWCHIDLRWHSWVDVCHN